MSQLSRYVDIPSVGFSTGTTNLNDVDTQGCEGVLFIAAMLTTGARTPSLALKSGASTTSFVACASTHTVTSTAAGFTVICKDVHKPAARYLQGVLTSTAQTPSLLVAIKYGMRSMTGNFSASANVTVANGGISRSISPTSAT